MSEAIITVENLGKRYSIRHQRNERYTALRDVISDKAKALFRRNGLSSDSRSLTSARARQEDFWALKNVSFEVKQGEVVGIIGPNGAGKSTLLKILSRITDPTEGKVRIKGRVASLLEVGTGFHPELTGRENIFLNGAILGMTRAEIKAKFDEIVAFAEIEKFLDTPVKRYSSGMYVRLAFAVAAYLEPEILVVDEVLAVGDAEFQKKCLGKMEQFSRAEGRTVLFVSHNMGAVQSLCCKAILLADGVLRSQGEVRKTIEHYLARTLKQYTATPDSEGAGMRLLRLSLHTGRDSEPVHTVFFNENCSIRCTVSGSAPERVAPVVQILTAGGELISSICGPEEGIDFLNINGICHFHITLGRIQLMPGDYQVKFALFGAGPQPLLELKEPLEFNVQPSPLPNAMRAYRADHGVVRLAEALQVRAG